MPLRGLGLIVFFLASIPVCFFRPAYGVVLWIVVAFLNPQSFTWTMFDAFPWAQAVAIPTMLGMLVFDRKFERLASRELGLMFLLWVWFTVTTLVSTSRPEFAHHAAETWERWNFVSKILLMTACMIPIVSSFERLRYVVLAIAGSFGFFVLKAFPFIITTGGTFRIYGPERSMVGDNNDFGLALNMTLPLFFFLAQTETRRWAKGFLALLFILTIPAVFFTYSRGAMVGLLGIFLMMLIRSRRRFALIPVGVFAVVLALSFAPEAWRGRMDVTRPDAVDGSAQSRLNAWTYARALAADYPITGGGFATFTEELYQRYWPGQIGNIYGPHSVYFQVLAEHGYVGLGLYLLLVLACFAATRRLRKTARTRSDNEIALYAQMFEFSLLGFLISGIFLGRAYFDYFFTIVACVAILKRVARDRWAATTEAARVSETSSRALYVPSPSAFGLPGQRPVAPAAK
jgi:probable O-glycosylation ligase (exosortase A-associated)